ncbi:hypothetical protein [Flavobacterium tistrianum]|uniref:hypothetical protein n=1 Tax=Flavobacterium tistrianum TaxID=1685414 RepID=UPI000DADFAB0|nr:hypothetical protein [Flavobacterium tistrianum]KAF2342280.1 hypothetical protein DMB71_05140 [Flavobacterium tistrianum]
MLKIIKVDKNIGLIEIDHLYTELYDAIKNNYLIDIIIPIMLKKNYLGITPSLIQYISTWIRYNQSGKLRLDIENPSDDMIRDIYENEFIFPIISLVWDTNGVFDKSGNNSLRNNLKIMQNATFLKMKKVEAFKGEKLLLTNFDHLSENKGILPCFERNGEFISNENELLESLKTTIHNDVLKYDATTRKNYIEEQYELNGIIYELMKNTFEWAKDNETGVPYDPNIRGLLMKFYKKTRVKLIQEYNSNNAVCDYFKSDLLKENDKGEIYFLEISVFDSGAGFVQKYKALNNDTQLNNIDIIKKCLIKHNTSAKGLDRFDKGLGLDRILNILNRKGFFRIKTGSTCLYRNLILNPLKLEETDTDNEMELFDWRTDDKDNFTEYVNASGSVITIIYPLSLNLA